MPASGESVDCVFVTCARRVKLCAELVARVAAVLPGKFVEANRRAVGAFGVGDESKPLLHCYQAGGTSCRSRGLM